MGPFQLVPALLSLISLSRMNKILVFVVLASFTSLVASAQTLSVVSGDGQVAAQNFQLPSPLVVVAPNLGELISGASGSVGSTPVRVNVYGIHNAGVQQVPNVAVRLIPDNPSGPSVACAAGTGITDLNGNANCQVIFSGPTGTST